MTVDDDIEIVKLLEKYLRRHNYEVIGAIGGKQALEYIKCEPNINLVITDLKMPEVTGIVVVKECIRLNIPVVLFTASAEANTFRDDLCSLGFNRDDILRKPIDLDILIDTVKRKLK